VLHIRQDHVVDPRQYPHQDTPANSHCLNFFTQQWANAFFNHIHNRKQNPKLHTLVIGSGYADDTEKDGNKLYYPQHCFVKGFQSDILGRRTAVAVPVSRNMSMYTQPSADILNYDINGHGRPLLQVDDV
jgi:hypothetical protein